MPLHSWNTQWLVITHVLCSDWLLYILEYLLDLRKVIIQLVETYVLTFQVNLENLPT